MSSAKSKQAKERSAPSFWRHDGYTLRCLSSAVRGCVESLAASRVLGPGKRVVDLGCGGAPYRHLFNRSGATYIGCDIESGPEMDLLIDASGGVPLPGGSADCVASFQVLEHVWDVATYLRECKRLMSDSGALILSTHGTWLYHPHPTDYRRWTRHGLIKELESNGFSVTSVRSLVGPLAWTTQFRAIALHHVLQRFGLLGRLASGALCTALNARMALEDYMTPKTVSNDNAAVYLVVAVHQESRPEKGAP